MYIYKTGVVGAGAMGAEIAQVITFAGLPVILHDIEQRFVDKGMERIRSIYARRVEKGKMSADELEKKMALVTTTTRLEDLRAADIVIEAVPEKMDLKKQVFSKLDGILGPSAILASNTSALSISALGSATKRPGRVIGLHFFYPAHVMKLIEIIPGLATSDETVDDALAFTESLRKIPIRVNECAGFLINRLLMPYLNECAYCLEEGSEGARAIDEKIVKFGLPMGPFTLVDTLGLDICKDVGEVLHASYGARMRPAALWRKLFEKKRFGIKSGAGFYTYPGGKEDPELQALAQSAASEDKSGKSPFALDRVLYQMINEAAYCLEERVSTAREIDLGMVAGLGFPQEKEGILRYADSIGLDTVLEKLTSYHHELGERFWPAPRIRRMVEAGFLGRKTKQGFFTYS
ncbi:MAG: 3-hydroxyacyl-CoA dehydrogenase [Candidatus Omnitrophica bacterium]|nr:3-hydroxyacyl-CoA dehydrogenase [Candidatus Omnitrophota bacterium]